MNLRKDLILLSEDDLVLLTNRGTVKRCSREIAEAEYSFELTDDSAGNLRFTWSDGAICEFPAAASLSTSRCSCPAQGICRHLVRSVLAYQKEAKRGAPEGDTIKSELSSPSAPALKIDIEQGKTIAHSQANVPPETNAGLEADANATGITPQKGAYDKELWEDALTAENLDTSARNQALRSAIWCPGDISDEVMHIHIKAAVIKRAKKLFNAGQVVELVTGEKPVARYFTLPAAVRFLVPGDCRYTHCNCLEEAPCVHAALSILAFRLLRGRSAAIVDTADKHSEPPTGVLTEVEALLREIASVGLAGLPPAYTGQLRKVAEHCQQTGLTWIAELIEEFLIERDRYHAGDALFSGEKLVEILAEVLARSDALVANTGAIPRIFITGLAGNQGTDQSSLRLVGLGCGVEQRHNTTRLTAYFHDDDSGSLVGIEKEVATAFDASSNNLNYSKLARSITVRGNSMHALGSGQVLSKGGKLTTSRVYIPGRSTPLALNPQRYNWEYLRFPVMLENFAELRSLLAIQPPPYLGPRLPGKNFHVCPINRIEDARFSPANQAIIASLIDNDGGKATLYHPYTVAGAEGLDATLQVLCSKQPRFLFIAGMFTTTASGLFVKPVSVVVEENGSRRVLQPWIEEKRDTRRQGSTEARTKSSAHPLQLFSDRLETALSELFIEGLDRSGEHTASTWKHLLSESRQLGFTDLSNHIEELYLLLDSKRSRIHWTAKPAAAAALKLCVIALVVREIIYDVIARI